VANSARTILVADGDPHLLKCVRQALDSLGRRHELMVVSQPSELQQYLQNTQRASRPPAAIVLNMREARGIALLAWIRNQRNGIADIPIVAVGGDPGAAILHNGDAAVRSPAAELIVDALRRVLANDGHQE